MIFQCLILVHFQSSFGLLFWMKRISMYLSLESNFDSWEGKDWKDEGEEVVRGGVVNHVWEGRGWAIGGFGDEEGSMS